MLGIPLEAPASDLPAFTQAASSSKAKSTSHHKRFSRSPSAPPSRHSDRSPPRIAQQKRSLGAIHVEDDSEPDQRASGSGVRRDDGYDSSDSDLSFVDKPFKDKPFIPSTKKASNPPPKPSTSASSSLNVQSGTKRPARKSPSPVPPRRSESPDDSRYSVGLKPAAKRLRTSRQHSFSPAPTAAPRGGSKANSHAPEIVVDDSSSEEGQVRESSYIEGQEELIPSDEDEDDLMTRKGTRAQPVVIDEDEEDDEARRERKADRRKAREAKRAFWAGKSGTSGRMGGMDSD